MSRASLDLCHLVTLSLMAVIGCGASPTPNGAPTADTSSALVVIDVPPPASAEPTVAPPLARAPVAPPPEDERNLNPDKPHCNPLPKVGTACAAGQTYCVVDWGSPGGSSTALWCQDGTWHRIHEANLE